MALSDRSQSDDRLNHDPERRRYSLDIDGGEAYLTYRDVGVFRVLDYSYVSPQLRGTGVAGELVSAVFESLIAEGQAARPTCGYIASVAAQRAEWRDHFLR